MPTLSAPNVSTYRTTTPNEFVNVICTGQNDSMDVSWVGPGGISGQRTVRNTSAAGEEVGPFPNDTTVTFAAGSGTPSFTAPAYGEPLQALVSGAGKTGLFGNTRNFLPLDPIAAWDDRAGTGATFELDPTVLFDGKPTIKITIPAGQTSARIGTLLETALMPRAWDKSGAVLALRCSKISAMSPPNVFIGELAGFGANFLNWGQAPGSYSQSTRDNEWLVYHMDKTAGGGIGWTEGGTYVNQVARRIRVSVALSAAQGEPVSFWIGAFGIKQPRPKPTLILTYDDCRASIYSHVYPLFKATRMPLSLAVISSALGTNGYMTDAQILEMDRDPSGLFEMVTHSSQHIDVVTRGDAGYVQDVIAVRDRLLALGVRPEGLKHHAWVTSVWTNGAIDGLKAAGFLSARAAGQSFPHRIYSDQCIRAGCKSRWLLNTLTTLGNTKNATGMIAEVDAWRAVGGFVMLNGHDFGPTSSDAYTMSISEHTQLIEYIASLRDSGAIDVMTWSQWFNTYCS